MMSDGGVYDKEPISQWLSLRDTAPCTNEDEGASRDVMELRIRKERDPATGAVAAGGPPLSNQDTFTVKPDILTYVGV